MRRMMQALACAVLFAGLAGCGGGTPDPTASASTTLRSNQRSETPTAIDTAPTAVDTAPTAVRPIPGGQQTTPATGTSTASASPNSASQKGQKKMCAGSEYMVTLYEDGPFYPGAPNGPSYVATGIRVENGRGQLGLIGGDRASGINKHVEVGQSVTHDGVGTFTLLDVAPGSGPGGGSAQFCFVPSEGFQVNDSLKK